ncbi:MAG: hypothetical protein WCJ49_06875, partial [Deltaproteobacteria bacterium]
MADVIGMVMEKRITVADAGKVLPRYSRQIYCLLQKLRKVGICGRSSPIRIVDAVKEQNISLVLKWESCSLLYYSSLYPRSLYT